MVKKLTQDEPAGTLDAGRFLDLSRAVLVAKREKDTASSTHATARKLLKNGGADLDVFSLCERLRKLEVDERGLFLTKLHRYMAWLEIEIPDQLNLFPADDDQRPTDKQREAFQAEREFDAGYHQSANGETRDSNPHPPGTPAYASWDNGWLDMDGQRRTAEAMDPSAAAPAVRKASTRRRREPAPGIEAAMAAHHTDDDPPPVAH